MCYGFRDINPAAPTHVLLIPKQRDGLTKLGVATAEHAATLGHMMAVAAPAVAKQVCTRPTLTYTRARRRANPPRRLPFSLTVAGAWPRALGAPWRGRRVWRTFAS